MTSLEQRWPTRLAARTELRDTLVAAYAAPHRGYHDTRHLTEVLDHLDTLLEQPEAAGVDREAVVLAAWFHDAVHAGRTDDEERSAALARGTLTASDVPLELVDEVVRLVRVTRDHLPEPGDLAGQVLCDADLAILASAEQRYEEYLAGVRREYAHLDEPTFRAGRARVLRALLKAPTMFHTPVARDAWERPARVNVERELAVLEQPSAGSAS